MPISFSIFKQFASHINDLSVKGSGEFHCCHIITTSPLMKQSFFIHDGLGIEWEGAASTYLDMMCHMGVLLKDYEMGNYVLVKNKEIRFKC
jgi:hypothetical protein